MATFKVGQRVRIIGQARDEPFKLIGAEGVIVDYDAVALPIEKPWIVRLGITDARGHRAPDEWCFSADELAPLLPPDEKADEFIARLKKLGSEPVNAKVTERVAK